MLVNEAQVLSAGQLEEVQIGVILYLQAYSYINSFCRHVYPKQQSPISCSHLIQVQNCHSVV